MRLEAASGEVSAMRSELALLNSRMAARDKQLFAHVEVRIVTTPCAPCMARMGRTALFQPFLYITHYNRIIILPSRLSKYKRTLICVFVL